MICIDLEKNSDWRPLNGAANSAPAFMGILPFGETSSASVDLWMRTLHGDGNTLASLLPVLVLRIAGHQFEFPVRQTGKTTMRATGFLGDVAVDVQLKRLTRNRRGREETFYRCIVELIEPLSDCGLWEVPEMSMDRAEQDAVTFFPE
jgi:hypothetical protein